MAEQQQPQQNQHLDESYVDVEDESNENAPLNPTGVSTTSSGLLGSPLSLSASPSHKTPVWYDITTVRRTYGQFDTLGSVKRFFYALIPSWITTHSATTPSKSGISALDGLRGIACLFVFNEHYVICYQSRNTQVWIMRVPFIRLLWYGKAAVFLFFVISGYVLSVKPLKLMRARAYLDFHKTISSSFLRRGIRLYLPCMIVSFIACVLTYMGFFDHSAEIYKQYSQFLFLKEPPPPRLASFREQFAGYLTNVKFIFSATIPFEMDTDVLHYFMYDDHQWTIPKEFRSSMVVFSVLVAMSRVRPLLRVAVVFALGYYAAYTARLYTALFMAGIVCAELDLIRQAYYARCNERLPEYADSATPDEKFLSTSHYRGLESLLHLPNIFYKVMWISIFTLGVFMISSPQEIQRTPNYLPLLLRRWGVHDIDNTLLLFGSIMVVWSTATCPSLGPLFNNPFVAYLGKISYALYLMHGTVIKSLGYNVLPWTLHMGTWTPWEVELDKEWWATVPNSGKVMSHILGLCFVATTCFWVSDLFWRFVDIPSVSFARKVENWMTKGADDPVPPQGSLPAAHSQPLTFDFRRARAASHGGAAGGHIRNVSGLGGLQDGGGPKRKNG
ncbi:hypothetical protein HRR83_004856 [Exophiala dermatitidis]|uniref:Acyltransferase 3 domain-containing protein n=2 Tax=Exophiala dermatitidis TaxID=5970 RepID=H6C3S0_EXODN|nr:uncharacterized protein HMPREF1120_06297 [Exophiala dermatitidis NIH/UT8656]KAJ4513978.1 hypothetical protein HRR75_004559 [Exophiala dermatitidis]EHY58285.1 hypothetical protein HMPREF1120_06297 [Exophiala dermatitidis NIH/UT8656]KAJ4517229.1 hypothetical protein HRR74_004979 [Exophiala dermatitidis]KAJ4519594.1 hypothetical protein HRR73_003654 [Exophiala dermatitidis]KAJ4534610.1 hypothetical protein HRR76_006529 [Exophiala dermatitidis]